MIPHGENLDPIANWLTDAKNSKATYAKILFSDDLLTRDCVSKMVQAFSEEVEYIQSTHLICALPNTAEP
jgi:hypothetical protein